MNGLCSGRSSDFGWQADTLGQMAKLAAEYPWKLRDDFPSKRRPQNHSTKTRFQGAGAK